MIVKPNMTVLIVDNTSPFSGDIANYIRDLEKSFDFKKYSEIDIESESMKKYSHIILSGRRENKKEINIINSKIIQQCLKYDISLLGICYGAEIISLTLGGTLGRLKSQIQGIVNIRFFQPNSFLSATDSLRVYESHGFFISRIPPNFETIAESDYCRNEIVKHKNKNIIGTQFHPEKSGKDGRLIFSNFIDKNNLSKNDNKSFI